MEILTFNKKYFTDAQIIDYVNNYMNNITIFSITDPESGYNYMSPVWTIFVDGYFFFSTDDNNLKSKFVDGKRKVGLCIIEPESYPTGRVGTPPYVTVTGTARIRRKEDFEGYENIIDLLYEKFDQAFPTSESKEEWINHILHESETRVLMEIAPEKTMVFQGFEKSASEQSED